MFAKRIRRLKSSLVREILEVAQNSDIISFAGGLPAQEVMPDFNSAGIPTDLKQYGTSEGEHPLRVEVAKYVTNLGRACSPEQVLITSGSQQGIDLVSKLFVDEGTRIILEAPTYLAAIQVFDLFGADFCEVQLDSEGLNLSRLMECLEGNRFSFCYLIPTFQNPSGRCYSASRRKEVAELLESYGVTLIEDDPYRELKYSKGANQPIVSNFRNNSWVYLGSFSKTGIPGLRIGYLVASPDLYAPLYKLKQATDLHTNRFGQHWASNYLGSPEFSTKINQLQQYYREKRDVMESALTKYLGDVAFWQKPEGGLFFWVQLNQQIDMRNLLKRSLDSGVAFMPGEPFYAIPVEKSGAMRLNFSHSTPRQILKGVEELSKVIKDVL
ncbi:MAG: PLP-dependent aminotransferase family protein [Proteobacteria bacterium]|nr:PLP-dependent aminotransferase family protein [Pseudomonadota bacterium]